MRLSALIGVLVLTTLAYLPVTTAGFVYEDRNLLAEVDPVYEEMPWGPWEGWAGVSAQITFKPRALANFTMHAQGWHADDAPAFHVVNLAVHELNGVLLWVLLLPLGAAPALGAAAVYLLHPIQSETVSYVSSRPDLLYATAVLVMLLATRIDGWRGVLLVTLCGGLALLAKESAVVVVGLLSVWLWYQRTWSARWWVPLGLWSAGGLLFAYRLFHIGASAGAPPWSAMQQYTSPASHGAAMFLGTQAAALWRLLALVIIPSGFSIDHDFDLIPPALAAAALMALAGVLAVAWRVRRSAPAITFAVVWVLVALSLRFVVPLPDYLGEHHTHVPFIGLWIALAAGLSSLKSTLSPTEEVVWRTSA